MKLIIQRVTSGSVKVDKEVVGEINEGLLVLLGVKKGDNFSVVDKLVSKLLKLRIMSDENGKMNLSIRDTSSQILVVSQFTLLANTKYGNRPSFIEAAAPEDAKKIYEYFVENLNQSGIDVQTGSFGSYMQINAHLDGPVTIILEE